MFKTKLKEILLVEDNEGDVELIKEALKDSKYNINAIRDGDLALDYLYKRSGFESKKTPSIILLDLNIPKTDGREILTIIKQDKDLRPIPVIVLTSSGAERDVLECYNLYANCYVMKPVNASKFMEMIREIIRFWEDTAVLPN